MSTVNSTFELPASQVKRSRERLLGPSPDQRRGRAWLGVAVWGGLTLATAALGGWASTDAASFYAAMTKPTWAPPAGWFGPVWTGLYVLMAIGAWLVWQQGERRAVDRSLALYALALVPNALWSWLFFAWHRGAWAMVDVVVLFALLVWTCVSFWRVRALAGALMLPVCAWVGFASVLNAAVWRMNPGLLGPALF